MPRKPRRCYELRTSNAVSSYTDCHEVVHRFIPTKTHVHTLQQRQCTHARSHMHVHTCAHETLSVHAKLSRSMRCTFRLLFQLRFSALSISVAILGVVYHESAIARYSSEHSLNLVHVEVFIYRSKVLLHDILQNIL